MSSKAEESNKLVRYEDVCAALIPILEDLLEMGNFKQVTDTIEALTALKDADLAKAVKEYCKAQPEDCKGCKYHDVSGYKGCIFTCNWVAAPEAWTI